MRILRAADHVKMPWANGGGVTYEVARAPQSGDFDWRVSFAEVNQSGPFSPLPGIDRVITLVSGRSLHLRGNIGETAVEHTLNLARPWAFPGEASIEGVPDGETVDLNLMTRRGRCSGAVRVCDVDSAMTLKGEGADVLFAVLAGKISMDGDQLGPLDVVTQTQALPVTGTASVAIIEIADVGA